MMQGRARSVCLVPPVVCLLGALVAAPGQQVRMPEPYVQSFHPPHYRPPYANPLRTASPAILQVKTGLFKPKEDIDFEKRQITFSQVDALGFAFWVYHYSELGDYLFGTVRFSLYDGWYNAIARSRQPAVERPAVAGLDFSLPVQYPRWAQRILGKEPPKLSIDGHLKLVLSYDASRQEPPSQLSARSSGFQFNQENQFTIRGSIGRVINISISAGNQEGFDFENQLKNFKIEYKDDASELEDEVVQEVVAGYTGFQMPGQGLAGYSESHEGLFGVKIRSKIGPVMLTMIASHEQGETQKLSVTAGGVSGGTTVYRERDYARYRYFFLDRAYLRHYLARAAGRADTGSGPPAVVALELWLQAQQTDLSNRKPNEVFRKAPVGGGELITFKLLPKDLYYLNEREGWIRLDTTVAEEQVLAMYLRTADSRRVPDRGDTTVVDTAEGNLPVMRGLAVLKSTNPAPSDSTFPLVWRNVYRMPRNIDPTTFTIDVWRSSPTDTHDINTESGRRISLVLGLTDANGKPYVSDKRIYDDIAGYLIIPPFADTLIGNQPFRNPLLGPDTVSHIYDSSYNAWVAQHRDRYTISMSGSTVESKKTTIDNLGWGVIPGTDRVTADGLVLARNVDYVINYEMGSIELLSPRARAANRIDVEYQREALFVPDKKVFLGAHAQMDLPRLGKNSFVGATVMWQDVTSNEKVPRLGQEPYNRLLLDVNTNLDFEPPWMTKLVDLLPLIRTEAESKANIQMEVAHSRVNPNTDGRAFVDDFEASKQAYAPGMAADNWYHASPPADLNVDTVTDAGTVTKLLYHPPAWDAYWFTPMDNDAAHRVRRTDIWILRDSAQFSRAEQYERVLRLHTVPAPANALRSRYVRPWAGIMTYIPASFADRSNDKYLEFWARSSGGGTLHIDFGVLSEDISIDGGPPDKQRQSEDTTNLFEPNAALDMGLDRRTDPNEWWVVPDPPGGRWDTLRYGDQRLPRPTDPSRDNWQKYDTDHLGNYRFQTGLEKNGGLLNSEDINRDGQFYTTAQERFYRVTIDLNEVERLTREGVMVESLHDSVAERLFLVKGTNAKQANGWHLFRIPLHDTIRLAAVSSGSRRPSLREVRAVRLWWNNFDSAHIATEKKLLMTGMQFVGNQWQELVTVSADSFSVPKRKIEASVVNSVEDPAYYDMLARGGTPITTEKDSRGVLKREQGLRLNYWDLLSGETALVERRLLYQTFDISNYLRLGVAVYSADNREAERVRFVFRFGTDSLSYYEYRTGYLRSGWGGNCIDVPLRELSQLKLAYLNAHGEDSLGSVDTVSADGHLRLVARTGRLPSFSAISWMALGVMRDPGPAVGGTSGEVWVNEMKVTEMRHLNGWAGRLSLATQWADFMGFSLAADYADADFRTMTEDIRRSGSSMLKGTMDINWRLDKFLPSEWGVSIPLGTVVSGSLSRPLKRPNTDIALSDADDEPDRLGEMFADAVALLTGRDVSDGRMTAAEQYQTTQVSRSWYTSYDKAVKSSATVTKLTAERIKANYTYRFDSTTTARGQRPAGGNYVDVNRTRTYNGGVSYDLSPRSPPRWTKWKPFEKLKSAWFPVPLKTYELSLLPSTFTINLAEARYVDRYTYISKFSRTENARTFGLTHGLTLNYTPLQPLVSLGYTLSLSRDLDTVLQALKARDENRWSTWWGFVRDGVFQRHADPSWSRYLLLYGERTRRQGFSLDFRPQFFEWLTHTFNYRADYNQQLSRIAGDPADYYNMSVGSTMGFHGSFEPVAFLRALSERTKKTAWLSRTFDGMQKGLDRIALRTISLRYDARSDLNNRNVGTAYLDAAGDAGDFLAYQLGVKGRSLGDILSGNMDDDRAYGGMRHRAIHGDLYARYRDDVRSASQKLSITTSFNIIPEPGLSISAANLVWERRYSVRPDPLWIDTTISWPKVTVNASAKILERLGIVKKAMSSVSLQSSYTYEHSASRKGNAMISADGRRYLPASATDTTLKHSWGPLVKLDGTLRKWPIRLRYEHRYDSELRKSEKWSKNKKHSDNVGLDYEIRKSDKERAIKILKWKVPITGRTSVGMTAERTHETSYLDRTPQYDTKLGALSRPDVEQNPTVQVKEYSFKPNLKYVFTNNVDALVQYRGGLRNEIVADRKTYTHLVELIVNIRF